jgi:7-cyano-7-deazaguanine synthase
MSRAVLLFSGGLDSTTLLWWLLDQKYEVECLSVGYGQRHGRELDSARAVVGRATADGHPVTLSVFEFPQFARLVPTSALTLGADVPHGHYENETMKATVVPNRNMVLLALGIARAISTKAQAVAYAAHSGDHTIYPDCRPEFVEAMRGAAALCDWSQVDLLAPFLRMSKADIVAQGIQLGAPYALTWTCYEGQEVACGRCGSCTERVEAFRAAGTTDPVRYKEKKR